MSGAWDGGEEVSGIPWKLAVPTECFSTAHVVHGFTGVMRREIQTPGRALTLNTGCRLCTGITCEHYTMM